MSRALSIDGFTISDESDCYVIAEIGHNHQGDIEKCKQLFDKAKECGANAVKLQKRHNRTLFTKEMYDSPYDNRNSYGKTYGEHREFLEFERDEYVELQAYAKELDITFFATAFDHKSADFLAELDVPAYKIASSGLVDTPLLKHIASFGKPMFVSTGSSTLKDVERAYDLIMPINPNLCILQCTSGYPSEFDELNLRVIETFRERFPDIPIGFSGHDNGIAMAIAAFVLGTRVVEKHFTLNRALRGSDHSFSLEPNGLRRMVRDLKRTRVALGDGVKRSFDSEKAPMRKMSKKIVAAKALEAGHKLAQDDIGYRIVAEGLAPYEVEEVIGRRLENALAEDDVILFDNLQKK